MQSLATNLNQMMAECGFLVPDSYIGNTNQDTAQLVAMAQAVAMTAVKDTWQILIKTYTIPLTTATTYALPSDLVSFVSGTAYQQGRWDRIDLPTTPEQWALLKSIVGISSMPIRARIIDNQFNILNPQAAATINIEYISNAPITDTTGVTPKKLFSVDSDLWILDDRMFQLEAKWRFKKEKGLEWQTDLQEAAGFRAGVRGDDNANSTIVPNLVSVSGQPYTNTWVTN
jgi:hypothetical protein